MSGLESVDLGFKDPDETIDYGVDLATPIGEAIATVSLVSFTLVFETAGGLTKTNEVVSGTIARFRLTGGTAGANAALILTYTLSNGEVLQLRVKLKVRNA